MGAFTSPRKEKICTCQQLARDQTRNSALEGERRTWPLTGNEVESLTAARPFLKQYHFTPARVGVHFRLCLTVPRGCGQFSLPSNS